MSDPAPPVAEPAAAPAPANAPAEDPLDRLWKKASIEILKASVSFALLTLIYFVVGTRYHQYQLRWYMLVPVVPAFCFIWFGFNAYAAIKHYFIQAQRNSS